MSQPPRATEPPLKFPPYVPQRVREYVAGLFETPGLRPEHADTLRRLTTGADPRMRDAWARLARIARTDEDYVSFVLAAWWARDDYGEWRERTRQAGELARRIAETARELAGLLHQIRQTHTRLPDEFWSLQALLWRSPSAQGAALTTPCGGWSGRPFVARLGSISEGLIPRSLLRHDFAFTTHFWPTERYFGLADPHSVVDFRVIRCCWECHLIPRSLLRGRLFLLFLKKSKPWRLKSPHCSLK